MSISGVARRASQGLVFLFPLFSVLINSWASSIFILLSLLSFYYFKPQQESLHHNVWINRGFALFFLIFAIKATLLGWQKPEIKALGVEVLFLLAFPLAHMTYRVPNLKRILLCSFSATLAILCLWGSYDIFVQDLSRFTGAYNPLRVSALALITSLICSAHLYNNKQKAIALLHYIAGAYVIYLSQGRMAMLAFLFLSLVLVLVLLPSMKQKLAAVILLVVASVIGLTFSDNWRERFGEVNEVVHYVQHPELYPKDVHVGSWITHYMMIEASAKLWKEYPILGVGRNHYIEHMQAYVEKGEVNIVLASKNLVTPHTLFAEILVSKGGLGILAFTALIIACLIRIFSMGKRDLSLFIFIASVLATGISEPIWVMVSSFVGILVIFTTILSQPLGKPNE